MQTPSKTRSLDPDILNLVVLDWDSKGHNSGADMTALYIAISCFARGSKVLLDFWRAQLAAQLQLSLGGYFYERACHRITCIEHR